MPLAPVLTLALTSVALAFAAPADADEVLVAVAANFAGTAEDLAAAYGAETGHRITLTTGATGKLYAQITAGAPFAILLSADTGTPEKLESEAKAVAGSRFTYALGTLALLTRAEGGFGDDPVAALTADTTRHIAIANPDLAPYGAAARAALTGLGLWDRLQSRIVMGENIGQAQTLVESGAATMGFVALPAVTGGEVWTVPADLYPEIRQDAVLLAPGADSEAAQGFLAFLRSDAARHAIAAAGYGLPGS